jgi:hypothetical protein
MDLQDLRKKIEARFKRKNTGAIIIQVSKNVKVRIEYMYGGKYCVRRKEKGQKGSRILSLLASSNEVVKLIMKEKTKRFTNLR